jgi:hypothetical protein
MLKIKSTHPIFGARKLEKFPVVARGMYILVLEQLYVYCST